MKRAILFIATTLLLTSCYRDPISSERTDNQEFHVEHIFTVDSCKVYRFHDGGRYHYIVIGPRQLQINNTSSSGKSYYDDVIETK
jgi:hypothetical protein